MKEILNEALEFFSFITLMAIVGFAAIVYAIFVGLYYVYAKVTGQEDIIQ